MNIIYKWGTFHKPLIPHIVVYFSKDLRIHRCFDYSEASCKAHSALCCPKGMELQSVPHWIRRSQTCVLVSSVESRRFRLKQALWVKLIGRLLLFTHFLNRLDLFDSLTSSTHLAQKRCQDLLGKSGQWGSIPKLYSYKLQE